MANRKPGLKARVREWLATQASTIVDEAARDRMARDLGVDPAKLRAPLRESGASLSPMVEGVRQDGLADLERTLDALAREYEAGDAMRRRAVRAEVILARQHAVWAARAAAAEKLAEKEEALLWLRTWLENPPLFPAWAALRRSRVNATSEHRPG